MNTKTLNLQFSFSIPNLTQAPHPQPFSPEYRGEGSRYHCRLRVPKPIIQPARANVNRGGGFCHAASRRAGSLRLKCQREYPFCDFHPGTSTVTEQATPIAANEITFSLNE